MSLGGTAPTSLAGALRYVRALYAQAGLLRTVSTDPSTGIEMLEGERYLHENGHPPRIVFVRDDEKVGGVLEIGSNEIGSRSQGCTAYVWGAETTDDGTRYDAADALLDRLMAAVNIAGAGRITPGTVQPMKDTNVETFGEEYRWRFEYARQVPRDATLEAAATALAVLSSSPDDPDRPTGGSGLTFNVDIVPTNARP